MNIKKLIAFLIIIVGLFFLYKYIMFCFNTGALNRVGIIKTNGYMKALFYDNYEVDMKVTYFSDDLKSEYLIKHIYDSGMEKIIYEKPDKFKGMTVEVTDKEIKHMNPYIQKNITYYTESVKSYNALLFSSFVKNYMNMKGTKYEESESKNCYILITEIPGENYHFRYQELYINMETKLPEKMLIKSKDKSVVCQVEYINMKTLHA